MSNIRASTAVAGIALLVTTGTFAATANFGTGVTRAEVCGATKGVCVRVATEPSSMSQLKKGYRWGGEDIEPPQFLITRFEVTVNGDEIFVPLSAFVDLGSPRVVEVSDTRRGFDVVIRGGDAAASYRALLVFEERSLVRRRVQHGEFPLEAWEETRYRFNKLKN